MNNQSEQTNLESLFICFNNPMTYIMLGYLVWGFMGGIFDIYITSLAMIVIVFYAAMYGTTRL